MVSIKKYALTGGPLVFLIVYVLPFHGIDPLSQSVLAVTCWMLVWWLTETVNLAVTALLPLVLFPLLGVMPLKEVSPNYANPLVFLFFGGFLIALGIEKWNLHRRIALSIIKFTGTSTMKIFLGTMIATAFMSMWISNTATTVMMLPIILSVVDLIEPEKKSKLAVLMLIGLAWSANIGGMATLIGTPPNLILAGFMKEELGREIFFSEWIVFGFPLSIVLLASAFFLLTRFLPKHERHAESTLAKELIAEQLQKLGPLKGGERSVLILFILTALAWIARKQVVELTGFTAITDTTIAMTSGILLFVIPTKKQDNKSRLLKWNDTSRLSWGILILFGGGLALASAIQRSQFVPMISETVNSLDYGHILLFISILALMGVFLTEVISNMALVTALLPLVVAISEGTNIDFLNLALPLTLGASCAFMLPMATPPNAIVFGSNRITVLQMARYGFLMNLLAIAVIIGLVYVIASV